MNKTLKKQKTKYQLTKPVLLCKKIKKDTFSVIIQGNKGCSAIVSIGKMKHLNKMPLVHNDDLIIIDIPMHIKSREKIIPNFHFPSEESSLRKKQQNQLYYYHITEIGYDTEKELCLSVGEKPENNGYIETTFPHMVSNAIIGLLVGGHM